MYGNNPTGLNPHTGGRNGDYNFSPSAQFGLAGREYANNIFNTAGIKFGKVNFDQAAFLADGTQQTHPDAETMDVSYNEIFDNDGAGFWPDADCHMIDFHHNEVYGNGVGYFNERTVPDKMNSIGVFLETSGHSGLAGNLALRHNHVYHHDMDDVSMYPANIFVWNSANVLIDQNIIDIDQLSNPGGHGDVSGIVLRPDTTRERFMGTTVVTDNVINAAAGMIVESGVRADDSGGTSFPVSWLTWSGTTYGGPGTQTFMHGQVGSGNLSLAQWQALGYDV
mgnify:CR=1 FL=1